MCLCELNADWRRIIANCTSKHPINPALDAGVLNREDGRRVCAEVADGRENRKQNISAERKCENESCSS